MSAPRGAALALMLAVFSTALPAAERILAFDADILVRADASMRVTERIAVVAEGDRIKRGIYRDFPTTYHDRAGTRFTVGFRVLSATRFRAADAERLEVVEGGRPEQLRTEPIRNGERVYIGNANEFLEPGVYVYEIVYETDRQIGYFADHDELYWNVTGNAWVFVIERASAAITLPASVPADSIAGGAYTGMGGSKGQDFVVSKAGDGRLRFDTTAPMPPGAGLTIVVGWPKGHVLQPDRLDRLRWFVADNAGAAAALLGLALVIAWYCAAWMRLGRDPVAGPLVPRYAPPAGYSPGSVRYISRMAYDAKTFSAALLDLAVRGRIAIRETDKGGFRVERTEGGRDEPAAAGEQALLSRLLPNGDGIDLVQRNHARIAAAMAAHETALERDYGRRYFVLNRGVVAVGVLLSACSLALAVWLEPALAEEALVPPMVAVGITLLFSARFLTRAVRQHRAGRSSALFAGLVVAVVLFAGLLSVLGDATIEFSPLRISSSMSGDHDRQFSPLQISAVAFVALLVATNLLFYYLMKAPTRAGRRLLDELNGLREYLTITDDARLVGAPDKTPEHYEQLLPYAVALECENAWSTRFRSVIMKAVERGDYVRPSWYSGGRWSASRPSAFATAVGVSLAAATAAASTAPGSSGGSSGSGGGGSSGGGGGGGGGGGW